MMLRMRTTLTLDDDLARQLQQLAYDTRRSFKSVVNEALRAGLAADHRSAARRYRVRPQSLGQARPGIDLTKALRLSEGLEDLEHEREIEARR